MKPKATVISVVIALPRTAQGDALAEEIRRYARARARERKLPVRTGRF